MFKETQTVLVIGGGGREYTLGKLIERSYREVYWAPGNGGTDPNSLGVSAENISHLTALGRFGRPKLTVVGPEVALSLGVVDSFRAYGLPIFGHDKFAAQLESDKFFSYELNKKIGVAQPEGWPFPRDKVDQAHNKVDELGAPNVVLKARGLAAGKDAFLEDDPKEAHKLLNRLMVEGSLGEAGRDIIIQERLKGPEASVFAICGVGESGKPVAKIVRRVARDYKLLNGLNTGGMGGYAHTEDVTDQDLDEIDHDIIQPVVKEMAERGHPLTGVLYAGLIKPDKYKVLEFNVRWGDPEAELVLPLIEDDLYPVYMASATGHMEEVEDFTYRPGYTVGVVLAAGGYPTKPILGAVIEGLDGIDDRGVQVIHAETKKRADGTYEVSGGRVLVVQGYDPESLERARRRTYAQVERIDFEGMQYRTDIAEA